MAFNKEKYNRLTVDLTDDEYAALHDIITEFASTKSAYVRKAIEEKIQRDQRVLLIRRRLELREIRKSH